MEQKRYESDMTPKEKRELEKKKLKQMTFPQKVEYIWAYYKLHMAIALAIILVIVFVGQLIYRSQFDTVFYAAIINGSSGDGEALDRILKRIPEIRISIMNIPWIIPCIWSKTRRIITWS